MRGVGGSTSRLLLEAAEAMSHVSRRMLGDARREARAARAAECSHLLDQAELLTEMKQLGCDETCHVNVQL